MRAVGCGAGDRIRKTGFSWHWERDRIGHIKHITRRPLAPGPGAVPLEMRRFEYFGPGLHAPLLAVHVPSLAPGENAEHRLAI